MDHSRTARDQEVDRSIGYLLSLQRVEKPGEMDRDLKRVFAVCFGVLAAICFPAPFLLLFFCDNTFFPVLACSTQKQKVNVVSSHQKGGDLPCASSTVIQTVGMHQPSPLFDYRHTQDLGKPIGERKNVRICHIYEIDWIPAPPTQTAYSIISMYSTVVICMLCLHALRQSCPIVSYTSPFFYLVKSTSNHLGTFVNISEQLILGPITIRTVFCQILRSYFSEATSSAPDHLCSELRKYSTQKQKNYEP